MKKQIKKSDYIISFAIIIISMLAVLYLSKWYQVTKKIEYQDSVLKEVIPVIKPGNLDSYLLETPNVLIYYSVQNSNTKNIENKLKKELIKYKEANILYIEIEETENTHSKVDNGIVKKEGNTINIYKFESGKLVDKLYDEIQKPKLKEITKFIKDNLEL